MYWIELLLRISRVNSWNSWIKRGYIIHGESVFLKYVVMNRITHLTSIRQDSGSNYSTQLKSIPLKLTVRLCCVLEENALEIRGVIYSTYLKRILLEYVS